MLNSFKLYFVHPSFLFFFFFDRECFTTAPSVRDIIKKRKQTHKVHARHPPKFVTAAPPAELLTSFVCTVVVVVPKRERYLYGNGNTFPFVSRSTIFSRFVHFKVRVLSWARLLLHFVKEEKKDDRLFLYSGDGQIAQRHVMLRDLLIRL